MIETSAQAFDEYACGVLLIAIRSVREHRNGLPRWRIVQRYLAEQEERAIWGVFGLFGSNLPADRIEGLKCQVGLGQ